MTNEAYKHLFESAISALAAIDRELGLPDDGCNATALTIAEIQRLKKLAAISNAAAKAETAAAVAKERERPSITLTTLEIADLAKFAGLLCGLPNRESREDQVTIEPCPEDGLRDDDEGEIWSSSWIAYMTEYPEEGSVTLGNTIRAGAKEPSDA